MEPRSSYLLVKTKQTEARRCIWIHIHLQLFWRPEGYHRIAAGETLVKQTDSFGVIYWAAGSF
jgi:hypothetical protein